jgi:ATP-dependent DNA ligase
MNKFDELREVGLDIAEALRCRVKAAASGDAVLKAHWRAAFKVAKQRRAKLRQELGLLEAACAAKAEGIISKRLDAAYAPGNRGLWQKSKCLQREEFIIIGYTEPEGSRPYLGALLLAYYDDDGRLVYAGRVGTGISDAELRRLYETLQPLQVSKMLLDVPPPRTTRFGSPLVLSRVHWVRPELVCEVRFLSWTSDGLLRQVAYEGLRADKPARDVRRPRPA